jgi:kumamolisin
VAWNSPALGQAFASGGGVSGRWFRPTYQREVKVPRGRRPLRRGWRDPEETRQQAYRGLPDVSAASDMDGGYRVLLGGVESTGAGTSAATPLWAGLIARLNESLGRPLGWIHPILYQPKFQRTFHDIVAGNNRLAGSRITYYRAASGWDACTGIGSPDGEALLKALAAAKGSGRPAGSRTQPPRRAKRDR